ncbi:hypothetical protein TKK_0019333 [Trichogramma kaykai]
MRSGERTRGGIPRSKSVGWRMPEVANSYYYHECEAVLPRRQCYWHSVVETVILIMKIASFKSRREEEQQQQQEEQQQQQQQQQ